MATLKLLNWRPLPRNNLIGFAKIELASGMIVSEVAILKSASGVWASPPGRPMIGPGGVVLKDEDGRVRHSTVIEFTSREIRDLWSAAVVEAVRAAYPGAFE